MGSAVTVVKQRTERHGKTQAPKRMVNEVNFSSTNPTTDKYEPSLRNEENSSRSKSRSSESANCSDKGKQARSDDPLNRKKKRLRHRLKMLTFFGNSNAEHTDGISFVDLEQSPKNDQKHSTFQDSERKKKGLSSPPESQENSALCRSHGDSNLTIVQSIHSPMMDNTAASLLPRAGSKELDAKIENSIVSSKRSPKEHNKSDDLDDKDVCRDARTPSPQFDEIHNVTLVPFNQSTKVKLSSTENKKSSSHEDVNADDGQMLEECTDSNLECDDLNKTRAFRHRPPSQDSERQPLTSDQRRRVEADADALPKESLSGCRATFNSPTVNNPVIENVLTSGEDFVDGLDDKFVLRGNAVVHDSNGDHGDTSSRPAPAQKTRADGTNGDECRDRRGSPEDSSSDLPQVGSRLDVEGRAHHSEGSDFDEVYDCQRNNSQTANYADGPYRNGLSLEKIECIQRQVYQEGLAPMWTDGGVAFYVPVEESGMRPPSCNSQCPSRLRVSRKSGLSCEERMILADVNRKKHLDKRKEFAVKQNMNVARPCSTRQDGDTISDFDTYSKYGDDMDDI